MKKDRIYILIFIIALAGFTFFEWIKPKPIDWSPSYSKKDKIPFGNYVLFSQLSSLFPGKTITPVSTSIYENVGMQEQNSSQPKNYMVIAHSLDAGEADINSLLSFAEQGNTVFLASDEFSDLVKDSLHFKTNDFYGYFPADSMHADSLSLTLPSLDQGGKTAYYYERQNIPYYFTSFDSSSATVLGRNGDGNATLLKIRRGNGSILVSSTPAAFTNFYMLKSNNADYIAKTLSFLPVNDVLWDEYFKLNRKLATSPLRVILNHEPLKWAYYISIVVILLFILFEAKRKQRFIPIVIPPANTTLEFVETVGLLYFQNGYHKDIALKKITYFLDFVRNHYYLKTNTLDSDFTQKLSEKSGKPLEEVTKLVSLIHKTQQQNSVSEAQLMELNRKLEEYHS